LSPKDFINFHLRDS